MLLLLRTHSAHRILLSKRFQSEWTKEGNELLKKRWKTIENTALDYYEKIDTFYKILMAKLSLVCFKIFNLFVNLGIYFSSLKKIRNNFRNGYTKRKIIMYQAETKWLVGRVDEIITHCEDLINQTRNIRKG